MGRVLWSQWRRNSKGGRTINDLENVKEHKKYRWEERKNWQKLGVLRIQTDRRSKSNRSHYHPMSQGLKQQSWLTSSQDRQHQLDQTRDWQD